MKEEEMPVKAEADFTHKTPGFFKRAHGKAAAVRGGAEIKMLIFTERYLHFMNGITSIVLNPFIKRRMKASRKKTHSELRRNIQCIMEIPLQPTPIAG